METNQIDEGSISFLKPVKTQAETFLWALAIASFAIYFAIDAVHILNGLQLSLGTLLGRLTGAAIIPFGFLWLCTRSKLVKNQREKVILFTGSCWALLALHLTTVLSVMGYLKIFKQ